MRQSKLVSLALVLVLVLSLSGTVLADWPNLSGESVELVGLWTGAEQRNFENILAEFSRLTNARVEYNPAGDQISTVVGTRFEGGNPPDLAIIPAPGILDEFVTRGFAVPAEDAVVDTVDKYYAPIWRDLGSIDGTLYGVWFKAANKSVVWYNANLFEEVGVESPETWEEMMEIAELMDMYGVPPFSLGGASSWTLTDWFENVYLRSAGPEMYDKLLNHEIPWTHESVIEAFTYLKQVLGNADWLTGGVEESLEATHAQGIIKPFVDPPQSAMAYGADFSATAIANETKAVLGEDALFFDFPSVNDSPQAVVGGGDAIVVLKDSEAAQALLRFLATPQAAEIWAAEGGFTSPNQGVNPDVYPTEIVRRSALALQQAEWFRFDMSDLAPSEFGSTHGTGMRWAFQEFVRNPDIEYITNRLEEDARKAY